MAQGNQKILSSKRIPANQKLRMAKELLIVSDYCDLNDIGPSILNRCDKLALTSSAMLALEKIKLPFMTLEDFYSYHQFRFEHDRLIQATDRLFSCLDERYEGKLQYPRAFTGNIYQFLIAFADIYYISRIAGEMKNKGYSKFYAIDNMVPGKIYDSKDFFYADEFGFINPTLGLDNKLKLFSMVLSIEHICQANPARNNSGSSIKNFRLGSYADRLASIGKLHLGKKNISEKRYIFVIQSGNEVSLLQPNIPDFIFINPLKKLLPTLKTSRSQDLGECLFLISEVEGFINDWFPAFKNYILDLFKFYHREVLGRLNQLSADLEASFDHYRPAALFFASFAHRAEEDLCADFANKRRILIFYFQHAGTYAFFKNIYESYHEQNTRINKINILQSSVEEGQFSQKFISFFKGKALGSIKLYNLYKKNLASKPSNRKKVLYCASSQVFYAFKDLMANVPDRVIYELQKNVLSTIQNYCLPMDIKVITFDEEHYYRYFKKLAEYTRADKASVLKGFAVERILRKYGLLILDVIGTALIPAAILLKIPVILYLKDTSYLIEETVVDLEKMFYLARDAKDFESYIHLFAEGRLESKFSMEFIDKYAFPVDRGDPAKNIANYIKEEILPLEASSLN